MKPTITPTKLVSLLVVLALSAGSLSRAADTRESFFLDQARVNELKPRETERCHIAATALEHFNQGERRDKRLSIVLIASHTLVTGAAVCKFQQFYGEVPLFNGYATVRVDLDDAPFVQAWNFSASPPREAQAAIRISPDAALRIAVAAARGRAEDVRLPEIERTIFPADAISGEYSFRRGARWGYVVTLALDGGDGTAQRHGYFIDALTGAVMHRAPARTVASPDGNERVTVDCESSRTYGSGHTQYSGLQAVPLIKVAPPSQPTRYILRDRLHGCSNVTAVNSRATAQASTTAIGDGLDYAGVLYSTDGQELTANALTEAADVYYSLGLAWDFARGHFGWNGPDGQGGPLESQVHLPAKKDTLAEAVPRKILYYDRSDGNLHASPHSPSVTAHEYHHHIWTTLVSNGNYSLYGTSAEAAALEEGFSEIFAHHLDCYRLNGSGSSVEGTVPCTWSLGAEYRNDGTPNNDFKAPACSAYDQCFSDGKFVSPFDAQTAGSLIDYWEYLAYEGNADGRFTVDELAELIWEGYASFPTIPTYRSVRGILLDVVDGHYPSNWPERKLSPEYLAMAASFDAIGVYPDKEPVQATFEDVPGYIDVQYTSLSVAISVTDAVAKEGDIYRSSFFVEASSPTETFPTSEALCKSEFTIDTSPERVTCTLPVPAGATSMYVVALVQDIYGSTYVSAVSDPILIDEQFPAPAVLGVRGENGQQTISWGVRVYLEAEAYEGAEVSLDTGNPGAAGTVGGTAAVDIHDSGSCIVSLLTDFDSIDPIYSVYCPVQLPVSGYEAGKTYTARTLGRICLASAGGMRTSDTSANSQSPCDEYQSDPVTYDPHVDLFIPKVQSVTFDAVSIPKGTYVYSTKTSIHLEITGSDDQAVAKITGRFNGGGTTQSWSVPVGAYPDIGPTKASVARDLTKESAISIEATATDWIGKVSNPLTTGALVQDWTAPTGTVAVDAKPYYSSDCAPPTIYDTSEVYLTCPSSDNVSGISTCTIKMKYENASYVTIGTLRNDFEAYGQENQMDLKPYTMDSSCAVTTPAGDYFLIDPFNDGGGRYSFYAEVRDRAGTLYTTPTVTITVASTKPSIKSFTADAADLTAGQSTVLRWDTTEATTVTLNGSAVALDGTKTITPMATTTYTLKAMNSSGEASKALTVTVVEPPPPSECGADPEKDGYYDLTVGSKYIALGYYDWYDLDNDVIDVYLNGARLDDDVVLTGTYQMRNVTLPQTTNEVTLVGVAGGYSSQDPITAGILVTNQVGYGDPATFQQCPSLSYWVQGFLDVGGVAKMKITVKPPQ